ncbi:MAG: hypothetical protein EZS28_038979 [Streblomastix strix]|uniref:Uncharacterized protein n=1 Tax=Streblomastix strix TaxID=222440 RepID=A0A5J4U5I4_9EUKA|nr:MAG: hypothetical protein EZS28_038979 [Streblomastix strix]
MLMLKRELEWDLLDGKMNIHVIVSGNLSSMKGSGNNDQGSGNDWKILIDVILAFDETKLRWLGKIIKRMLGILVRQTCGTFADGEQMMDKYRIPRHHSNIHISQDSVLIRKLYTTILHIAQSAENFKYPIPSTFSQTFIQLYTGWLVDHVSKIDREQAALLNGKAPDSELERDVKMLLYKTGTYLRN